MSIAMHDRKVLWAKSGGRCAICRCLLVHPPRVAGDGHAVIGEECHIVSPRHGGPRSADPINSTRLDGYENLLLLCPTDHSLIDTAVAAYPSDRLKDIKHAHESWWSSQAVSLPEPVRLHRGAPTPLVRIASGRELMAIVGGAEESSLDGRPETQEEVDLIAGFIQEVSDASEIWDDIEPGNRLRHYFDFDSEIKSLEAEGWGVFATRAKGTISGGALATPSSWDCAYVRVVRLDSPEIVTLKP